MAGESLRRRALKIEREIRRPRAAGTRGTLLQLWDKAVATLGVSADEAFARDAGRARGALAIDGEVSHCDAALPARFVRHAWRAVQQQKARAARVRIDNWSSGWKTSCARISPDPRPLAAPALQASFGCAHRWHVRLPGDVATATWRFADGSRGGLDRRAGAGSRTCSPY